MSKAGDESFKRIERLDTINSERKKKKQGSSSETLTLHTLIFAMEYVQELLEKGEAFTWGHIDHLISEVAAGRSPFQSWQECAC